MNKKIGVILLSLLAAVVIFLAIIGLQNKMIYPGGAYLVYFAKKPISKNTEITQKNISAYFVKRKVSRDILVDSAITDVKGIINMYVTDDIVKGEQISAKKLDKTSDKTKYIKNLVEYSIKFSDISQVVGGTLRDGDIIDLILTQTGQGKVTTQTELKNVVIDKSIAADGSIISRDNGGSKSATVLTLDLSAEDAHKLDNAVASGNIKALKKLDNSTYEDITIENKKSK